MTDTESRPKSCGTSTHFIANIVLGILYLALAVFVLTVAITGTTDGPVLAVLAGTALAALAFHYFIAARKLRHTPSVKGAPQ
jgi:ABC-type transport system involved in multi-copper enzyme maturation permease subunit